jgi:hypothetical protein
MWMDEQSEVNRRAAGFERAKKRDFESAIYEISFHTYFRNVWTIADGKQMDLD